MTRLVTIFGGSGFVGRYLVRSLAKKGWRVRVAVRRPDLAGFLQPLGSVGQVTAVQANIRNRASVIRALEGADAVVNLVGILNEGGRQSFGAVQANGPRTIAEAAAEAGIADMVHVSAIGADKHSASDYYASKAYGEEGVRAHLPGAIIIRPSLVFGPEDDFTNRFANMARFMPFLPLIGGGDNHIQPVYAGDVAEAIVAALEGKARPGTTYEIGGPQAVTFKSFLDYVLKETGRWRMPLKVPFWLARLKASFLQVLPGKLLTVDQVNMLETDNVVSEAAKKEKRTLIGLGITATAIESVAPSYLVRYREKGQFEKTHTA